MPDGQRPEAAERLTFNAMLYAGGELTPAEAAAFENRLADDQDAREALANAVQLTLALTGRPQRPDPAYRARVRATSASVGWWGWLSQPRFRRGPAVAWVGLGTVAAVACMAFPAWFEPERLPEAPIAVASEPSPPLPMIVTASPAPEQLAVQPEAVPPMDAETAVIWEEMSNTDHLQRVYDEEQRRRAQRGRESVRQAGPPPSGNRVLSNSSRDGR